jgi:hypothetical protein
VSDYNEFRERDRVRLESADARISELENAAVASALRVKELTLALERLKAGGERVMALGDEADCELAVAVFVEIASKALMVTATQGKREDQ